MTDRSVCRSARISSTRLFVVYVLTRRRWVVARLRKETVDVQPKNPLPKCRQHGDMEYHPEDLLWRCVNRSCKTVKRPPLGEDFGKPIVLKGDMELVSVLADDGSRSFFIRVKDNNILVNVTDHMSEIDSRVKQRSSGPQVMTTVNIVLPLIEVTP